MILLLIVLVIAAGELMFAPRAILHVKVHRQPDCLSVPPRQSKITFFRVSFL